MKRRILLLLALSLLVCGALANTALAAGTPPAPETGLLITPLRQFISIDAGSSKPSTFTIANLTTKPLDVTLSVKQFSVTDYTYDYRFQNLSNNWLHLSQSDVILQPNQTKNIAYSFEVPTGSAPGGHYYTLFASAQMSADGVANTVQAADLVYLTVTGDLTQVSHLKSSSISWLTFGRTIPFTLNPINTGNVYSFVYVSSQLHGLFVHPPETSTGHLLMPGKVRTLTGSIPSPVLPGIYRATYGYKTSSDWIIEQSHLVVFIPPWFVAFVLAALLISGKFLPRGRRSTKKTPIEEDEI
jgi:hypothetical protein